MATTDGAQLSSGLITKMLFVTDATMHVFIANMLVVIKMTTTDGAGLVHDYSLLRPVGLSTDHIL